jgi:hypothetical protein
VLSLDSLEEARDVTIALFCSDADARRISKRGVNHRRALSLSHRVRLVLLLCGIGMRAGRNVDQKKQECKNAAAFQAFTSQFHLLPFSI